MERIRSNSKYSFNLIPANRNRRGTVRKSTLKDDRQAEYLVVCLGIVEKIIFLLSA